MTVDEALTLTDEIQKGRLSEGKDHYALVLAAEVRRLREADQAYIDTIEDLHDEIGRLRAVLAELD